MNLTILQRGCVAGLLTLSASLAWSQDQGSTTSDANPETATLSGTVTALDQAKHQFTLREDGSGENADYRPYWRTGYPGAMIARIAKLTIGDHVHVTYTEHEGRRVTELSTAPAAAAK